MYIIRTSCKVKTYRKVSMRPRSLGVAGSRRYRSGTETVPPGHPSIPSSQQPASYGT